MKRSLQSRAAARMTDPIGYAERPAADLTASGPAFTPEIPVGKSLRGPGAHRVDREGVLLNLDQC